MIARILFLTAAAYAGYRYIRRSNRKAHELRQSDARIEILPPEATALEYARPSRAPGAASRAAEPDPGR